MLLNLIFSRSTLWNRRNWVNRTHRRNSRETTNFLIIFITELAIFAIDNFFTADISYLVLCVILFRRKLGFDVLKITNLELKLINCHVVKGCFLCFLLKGESGLPWIPSSGSCFRLHYLLPIQSGNQFILFQELPFQVLDFVLIALDNILIVLLHFPQLIIIIMQYGIKMADDHSCRLDYVQLGRLRFG